MLREKEANNVNIYCFIATETKVIEKEESFQEAG